MRRRKMELLIILLLAATGWWLREDQIMADTCEQQCPQHECWRAVPSLPIYNCVMDWEAPLDSNGDTDDSQE